MTLVLPVLVVVQAALLLWSSVNLSNVFLLPNRGAHAVRFALTFGVTVVLAWYGRTLDAGRLLCGMVDCVALAVGVGGVRLWLVNKEGEQFALERELAQRAAAEAAVAARQAYEEEKVRAAAAALAARSARVARGRKSS